MSTFEVVIPILVASHTQPHLRVRKTLYLVNPFRIKFKVALNIGSAEVLPEPVTVGDCLLEAGLTISVSDSAVYLRNSSISEIKCSDLRDLHHVQ